MARKKKPKEPTVPPEAETTRRRQIETLLGEGAWSVEALRRALFLSAREIESELEHLDRSLRRRGSRIDIEPAECLACGHVFAVRKSRPFHAPGRCPECKAERVEEPRFRIRSEA